MTEVKSDNLFVRVEIDNDNNLNIEANMLPRGVIAILANAIEQVAMGEELDGDTQ